MSSPLGEQLTCPSVARRARSRRRTPAAPRGTRASSALMRVEPAAHQAVTASSDGRRPRARTARWRGSWSARADRTRRARSRAPRRSRRARRTRRASTTARPAGARADGRRYWPSVTMSTPTPRRSASAPRTSSSVSPMPRMMPDFVDEPGRLRPAEHRERPRVARRRPRRALQPGDRLEVVVQHVGRARRRSRRATSASPLQSGISTSTVVPGRAAPDRGDRRREAPRRHRRRGRRARRS